jgi:hypothetical protein
VLVVVVIAQTIFLVRERREVARREQETARLKDQRSMFCVFYHGAVQTNRLAMADAPSDNRAFGHLFYQLSMSPYLDLCHVDERTKANMAARNWGCESVVGGYDYPCLARVARELEDAIPLTP